MKLSYYSLLVSLAIIFLQVSCTFEEDSDQYLLEKDKKELAGSLKSDKILIYKFGKIAIRSSAVKDPLSDDLKDFQKDLQSVSEVMLDNEVDDLESLTVLDYLKMYRTYRSLKKFVIQTDEDIFPTLIESLNFVYGDSNLRSEPFMQGEERIQAQNIEHALLSIMVLFSKDLGKEVSLYECSKTNPESLPDSEIKGLLQFCRAFLFFEKGLFYLSEDEISRNINWLNENQKMDLRYTRMFFRWGHLNDETTYKKFHAINHLFRGMNRLMMEREIDDKRALEDFEVVINDAHALGVDNELIWGVETYFYLKNDEPEKAILAMSKLEKSKFFSQREKKHFRESIEYVKNRKSDDMLNGVFDKYFLSKVASKYLFSILAEVNWEKVLKDEKVPHVEKIFENKRRVEKIIQKIEKYSSAEGIEEKGEQIKQESKRIWEKAKGLLE
ncbi:MAG: short-chain dehydrogenase [Flavobacteriales bacterium]|jgi:hypothetical protein|nr:short-chain dehydrogenase [Flavobacteriales bacterium]